MILCDVSGQDPTRCLHCRPRAYSPPPTHGARFGALFSARYPGVCSLCYGGIDEHDEIAAVLDENDDTDGYACPWCIDGEEPNPCAVPSGRREELTGRLLALLTDTPSVSLAVIANVVGVLPEQVWSLMAPLLRSGRLSYVAGRGNKPHTYTVHAERQAAR